MLLCSFALFSAPHLPKGRVGVHRDDSLVDGLRSQHRALGEAGMGERQHTDSSTRERCNSPVFPCNRPSVQHRSTARTRHTLQQAKEPHTRSLSYLSRVASTVKVCMRSAVSIGCAFGKAHCQHALRPSPSA